MCSDKQNFKKEIIIALVSLGIYFLNGALKSYINIPVVDYLCKNHLNDFLGGIVFCAYTNIVIMISHRRAMHRLKFIIPYITICGICWEYIFPLFLSQSTSDFWDVISYALGGFVYYLLFKIM